MELEELGLRKPLQEETAPYKDLGNRQLYFSSSWISKLLFTWIYPTLKLAHVKPLEVEDLHELKESDTAGEQVMPYIEGQLIKSIVSKYKSEIMIYFLIHLSAGMLTFIGPFYVVFLEKYFDSDEGYGIGFISLVVVAALFLVETFLVSQDYWRGNLLQMNLKASITNLVYEKALRLTTGASTGKTVNILQVDASRIYECIPYLSNVVVIPIQIAVGIYLLFYAAGLSAFAGLGTIFVLFAVTYFASKKYKKCTDAMMTAKDERMKCTTELFNHIKMLKIYCLEHLFMQKTLDARDAEIQELRRMMVMGCFSIFSLWGVPVFTAITIFLSYEYIHGESLDSLTAFTTLSTLYILQSPLRDLPFAISTAMQALVSSKRINEYLALEEVKNLKQSAAVGAVSFENATFAYGTEISLRNVNLTINPGEFVAVVGPVGSGKSSILSAIMGEMNLTEGSYKSGGTIAYTAALETWIQNATLRNNVIFNNPVNEKKYKEVLEACALNADLAALPGGDMTEIGEKGINLSGGQKARVGLARALYSNRDIYLLDDPLASVDNHVAKHLFYKCFVQAMKGKTRILVTHSTHFLHLVDRIIVMKDGTIEQIGNFQEVSISKSITEDHNETTPKPETATTESKLIEEEDREKGKVNITVYSNYFRYCGGLILGISAIMVMLLWQGLRISSDIALKNWGDSEETSTYIKLYVYLGLSASFCILLRCLIVLLGGVRGARVIFIKMVKALVRAPVNLFFDVTPTGRILNRLSKDMSEIDTNIPFMFGSFLAMVFGLLGVIIICIIYVPWVLALLPVMFVLGIYVQKIYITGARELTRLDHISKSPIVNNFTETLSGMKTIRAFQAENEFRKKNEKFLDDNLRISYNSLAMMIWMGITMSAMCNVLFACVIGLLILNKDNLTPGAAGLCISYLLSLGDYVNSSIVTLSYLENSMVSVERADAFTKIQSEAPESTLEDISLKHWPSAGKVEFHDVQMKYRPNTSLVLFGLNFTIRGGEKVGIVGRTGSGKSSITMTLLRIVELHRGKIFIDDIDISKVGLKKLRKSITLIPQDPVLFKGTLKFNLDPYGNCSDSQARSILNKIGLDHVNLHDEVSEGGTNFSVGERQLMCIARAGISNNRIMMLDEATAAIDLNTHNKIQTFLKDKFPSTTMMIIAHRLDTVMECNRVLVLEKGRVIEFEEPKVLLSDPGSAFFKLSKQLAH
jgi:ATP-binding cassette subfamily C (CFTR/MRP) protein 1